MTNRRKKLFLPGDEVSLKDNVTLDTTFVIHTIHDDFICIFNDYDYLTVSRSQVIKLPSVLRD